MSLDVTLTLQDKNKPSHQAIFIREDGATKEISREEWDKRYPGREPYTCEISPDVYSANITHNLIDMADAAGIYEHLWRPDEIGIKRASELIEPLTNGLAALNADPIKFKALNPKNGWGTYEGLVGFVTSYLAACKESPEALVHVSR